MKCWRCNQELRHGELGIGRTCRYRLRSGHIEGEPDFRAADRAQQELVSYLYEILRPHPTKDNIVQDRDVLRPMWKELPFIFERGYKAMAQKDLNEAAGMLYVALCTMRDHLHGYLAETETRSIEGLPDVLPRFARVFDALGLTGEAADLRRRYKKTTPASGVLDGANGASVATRFQEGECLGRNPMLLV